jgi:hypothetical protein
MNLKSLLRRTAVAAPLLFGMGFHSGAAIAADNEAKALLQATCANCWADAGQRVREHAKLDEVAWDCAAKPCPGNGPLASAIAGSNGVSAVLYAWSGGIYDTADDALIVWGGGHNDYYGNEVYAFALKSLAWSRLTVPSSTEGHSGGPAYADGKPSSSHSYDGLAYLPETNRMLAASINDQHGNAHPNSFLFDLTKHVWQPAASNPALASYDNIAVYSAANHAAYVINSAHGLQRYDPGQDRWGGVGNAGLGDYHQSGALQGAAGPLVTVGCCSGTAPSLYAIDLRLGIVSRPLSKGDQTCERSDAPGFVWDGHVNRFICWSGGKRLWSLDPATWEWRALSIASADATAPGKAAENGVFGKFQYLPDYGALIAITKSSETVHLFKCDGVQC